MRHGGVHKGFPRNRGRGYPHNPAWNRNSRGGFNTRGGRGSFGGPPNLWRGRGFRGNAGTFRGRPRPETPGKRLTEEDISITEYITKDTGFNGIIKYRFSDFQVSEINLKGEVARLTTQTPPMPPVTDTEPEDDDDLLSRFDLEVLPIETWDRINLLVTSEPSAAKVEIDVTGMTKEGRTKIHDAVKKVFQESIVGSTVTVDEKKFVVFERYRKGVRIDNRTKWAWPLEYVYFIVHKENCGTMEAAERIAGRLGLLGSGAKVNSISFAGNKDRRAKTSQWFSVRKYNPKKISIACEDMGNIHLGNYSFSPEPLKLGMLKGNRFRIALRHILEPDDKVEAACLSLKKGGFINYYGLQRFGTNMNIPTYDTGRKLLKSDFRGAINNILQSQSPRSSRDSPEAKLQRALEKNPKDLQAALSKIHRNTKLLYLHSYQSYVWNQCVSERIRRFGLNCVVGDLVPVDDEFETEELELDPEDDTEKEGDESSSSTDVAEQDIEEEKSEHQQVKPLTEDDIASNKYTIFDILLPLPGYNIVYPENMKDYYQEILTKDGLTMELRNRIKAYSMGGAYRRVVCTVGDMSWTLVRYKEARDDLIRSDIELLKGEKEYTFDEEGDYKALLLEMSLPSSSYATMALRELMKVKTDSDSQASQNHFLNNKNKQKNNKEEEDKEGEENKESDTNSDLSGDKKRKLDDSGNFNEKKMKLVE